MLIFTNANTCVAELNRTIADQRDRKINQLHFPENFTIGYFSDHTDINPKDHRLVIQ